MMGNAQNKNIGPYRGTCWVKKSGKWQAYVEHRHHNYYLGLFVDRDEAAKAAANKRKELGFLDNTPITP